MLEQKILCHFVILKAIYKRLKWNSTELGFFATMKSATVYMLIYSRLNLIEGVGVAACKVPNLLCLWLPSTQGCQFSEVKCHRKWVPSTEVIKTRVFTPEKYIMAQSDSNRLECNSYMQILINKMCHKLVQYVN